MSGPFKMKGHSLPGPNQASPAKQKVSGESGIAYTLRKGLTKLAIWHKKTEAKARKMYKPKARGVHR